MPSVLPGDVHLNGLLTQWGYGIRVQGTVGSLLSPIITVANQYGAIPKYDRESWFRSNIPTLGAMGEAPKSQPLTLSNTSFSAVKYHAAVNFNYETLDESDPIDLAMRGAEQVKDRLMIDQDQRLASKAWAGVGSSSTYTSGNAWVSSTSSPCSHV